MHSDQVSARELHVISNISLLNNILLNISTNYNELDVSLFVEAVLDLAKYELYDVTGTHTSSLYNDIRTILNKYIRNKHDIENLLYTISDIVKYYMNILVMYNLINEEIYVMEVTQTHIIFGLNNDYTRIKQMMKE